MLYRKYAAKIINCNMVQIQPRSDRGHFLPSKIPFIVLVAICAPLGLDTDGLNFIFDRDCTKRIIRHTDRLIMTRKCRNRQKIPNLLCTFLAHLLASMALSIAARSEGEEICSESNSRRRSSRLFGGDIYRRE